MPTSSKNVTFFFCTSFSPSTSVLLYSKYYCNCCAPVLNKILLKYKTGLLHQSFEGTLLVLMLW